MSAINRLSIRDKSKRTVLITAALLVIVNILVIKVLRLEDFTFRSVSFTFAVSFSVSFIILHIITCIVLRIKRKQLILKGIFIYQIIGALSFAFLFMGLLAGKEIKILGYIFSWWSLPLEPVSEILALGGFFPVRIIRGIVYLVYVFITGNSYLQIKKDLLFEKKIAEKKAMEEQSNLRHG